MGLIYKITNSINDEIYIGQTTQTVEIRFKNHMTGAVSSNKKNRKLTKFQKAIIDIGPENFSATILEDNIETQAELSERELYYIEKYNAIQSYNTSNVSGPKKPRAIKVHSNDAHFEMIDKIIIHNDFTKLNISKLSNSQMNLLMWLLQEFRIQGTSQLKFSFTKLAFQAGLSRQNPYAANEYLTRFKNNLEDPNNTILRVNETKEVELIKFDLFTKFILNDDYEEVELTLNKKFEYLISNLPKKHISVPGEIYLNLSSHSKKLLLIILNNRKNKVFTISRIELLYILGLNFDIENRKFHQKILHKSIDELNLQGYVKELSVNKYRIRNKIVKYEFSFSF